MDEPLPPFGIPFEAFPPFPSLEDAWECADCGWTVRAEQLGPGWSLAGARDAHSRTYCARPSP